MTTPEMLCKTVYTINWKAIKSMAHGNKSLNWFRMMVQKLNKRRAQYTYDLW